MAWTLDVERFLEAYELNAYAGFFPFLRFRIVSHAVLF